jgi:photosystem II stability/assembly factor-like uncharacterized protein
MCRGRVIVSQPAGFHSVPKLLICIVLAISASPAISASRWAVFGPENSSRVNALRADRSHPQILYLASDRGIFISRDGGAHWGQSSSGLHGYSVFALEQALNGTWVAGTDHGIFLLPLNATAWSPSNTVVNEQGTPRLIHVNGITRRVMTHHATRAVLQARINDIEIAPNRWLAATSKGIFSSSDQGKLWSGGPVNGEKEFVSIKAEKELVAAATPSKLLVSSDGGTVWSPARISSTVTQIRGLVISHSRIFAAGASGLFRSADAGATWERLTSGLPAGDSFSINFDSSGSRLLAYSSTSGLVYESPEKGQNWSRVADAGIGVQTVCATNGRLFAITDNALLAGPEKPEEDAAEGSHRSNWFVRLVHRTE